MPNLRVLSVTRFWRCYVLLLIASMLSLFLIFISQNDPSLKIYFQYFQPYSFSKDEMVKLMEPNKLDYEFLNIDPRACYRHQQASALHRNLKNQNEAPTFNENDLLSKLYRDTDMQHDIEEDFRLLNEAPSEPEQASPNLKILLLSIGKSVNYKSRLAARQTWYKFVNKQEVKLMFVVGNPAYVDKSKTSSTLFRKFVGSDLKILSNSGGQDAKKSETKKQEEMVEAARLEKEIKDYGDIIQINMPDDDDLTSTKTIFAIRWAITYCELAQNLFILSDSAVVNHHLFNDLVLNGLLAGNTSQSRTESAASGPPRKPNLLANMLNDSSIVGVCDHSDEKFAMALREFIIELYKNKPRETARVARSDSTNNDPVDQVNSSFGARKIREATSDSGSKTIQALQNRSSPQSSSSSQPREPYKGQFCSNLGWMVTLNGAKKLWTTALRTSYMMARSPAYLNGYLAFKADLRPVNFFEYHEEIPEKLNCHKLIEAEPKYLLCAENFTVDSRYTNYMASWNSVAQSQFNLAKL